MFADEIRRAVEDAPRVTLPGISAVLWKAYSAGQVTEAEAEELSALIEARKALPAAPKPVLVRRGSRPRSDASMERRRRWAASGRLPPALAARFTTAEVAVLAVVAAEAARHGRCTLAHGHLAAVAGVSESTVKRAIRAARDLGLLQVEERRVSAFRNLPNVVTIVSREWLSWLRLAPRQGGGQSGTATHTKRENKAAWRPAEASRGAAEGQGDGQRRGLRDSSASPGRVAIV